MSKEEREIIYGLDYSSEFDVVCNCYNILEDIERVLDIKKLGFLKRYIDERYEVIKDELGL